MICLEFILMKKEIGLCFSHWLSLHPHTIYEEDLFLFLFLLRFFGMYHSLYWICYNVVFMFWGFFWPWGIWDLSSLLLLLLLRRFSRVWLCATPQTVAHQAPPSLGSSRQEHWSGLPFPSPMHASEKWKWSCSVMSTLSDPMDCSLPGSSVHGIFQARVLEWGAIAFSDNVGKPA